MWGIIKAIAAIFNWIMAAIRKQKIKKEVEDEINKKGDSVVSDFDSTDGSKVREDDPDLFS